MSAPIILRNFKFTRDFRHIKWKETLWYNLLRSTAAGVVLGLLMHFTPQLQSELISSATTPLIWPFAYLFVFLPLGVLFSILKNLPFAGLIEGFLSLIAVSAGDPLVSLLYKFAPQTVPVESPPFFGFFLVFWVLDAEELLIAE